jgi:hypothetical protein
MESKYNLKTAALILFGAAVFLLISNLVLNIADPEIKPRKNRTELNSSEIDSLFRFSLFSFGLHDDWIREIKDSKIEKLYKVKIPADLSIPVILEEINSNFWETDVTISSDEKKFSGRTFLEVSAKNIIKLRSEFNYYSDLKRSAGKMAFILEELELSSEEDSSLLEIPEPFSPLLIPSIENVETGKFIIQKSKTYSLLLNDDIADLKYKLKDSYSKNRLKGSLLSIINDFGAATYFFIDDQSGLYNSSVFDYLHDELTKRKIKIVKLSKLKMLKSRDENLLKKSFDDIMKEIVEGQSISFLVNCDDFRILLPQIKRYRKVGHIILHPSETKLEAGLTEAD